MEEKVKKKTTFWLPPDMIDRMDSWLKADNCRSRNEFVEKALRFYMGYLGTEDNTATRELRAYAVDEVKRTNGQVSFENAVRSQRRIEPDDTWPGSY